MLGHSSVRLSAMSDVRVIPFKVSELRLPPAEQEELQREWWPSYAHAVVHSDGIFLFDNGAGFGNEEVETTFTPRVTAIEDALAEHGISLADITGAANCHLHFDHSGQNVRIPPGVPIFVQRAEWAKVHEADYTVPEWIDVPGLTYEVLDGEIEVAPGMRLIPTPGHTPGHQSLVLDASDGTVVLAGQRCSRRPSGRVRRSPRGPAHRPRPTPATRAPSIGSARSTRSACTSRTMPTSGSADPANIVSPDTSILTI